MWVSQISELKVLGLFQADGGDQLLVKFVDPQTAITPSNLHCERNQNTNQHHKK